MLFLWNDWLKALLILLFFYLRNLLLFRQVREMLFCKWALDLNLFFLFLMIKGNKRLILQTFLPLATHETHILFFSHQGRPNVDIARLRMNFWCFVRSAQSRIINNLYILLTISIGQVGILCHLLSNSTSSSIDIDV